MPPDIRLALVVNGKSVGVSWRVSSGHTGRTFALKRPHDVDLLIAQVLASITVQEHLSEDAK